MTRTGHPRELAEHGERPRHDAPLRAARIAECKASGRNDPGFCERYWRDLGNAVRTRDGRWLPRLFDDLPECVAAHEARRGRVRS